MIELLKTTENLRKELEKLRREEIDTCLDFSHKIKPLEEQLKAAEKGDLLFEDVQLQSKLAYVNDLFSREGIRLFVARKSDLLDFTSKEQADTFYNQLALFYRRRQDKGLQLLYTFDKVKTVGELLNQLILVEKQLELLEFLCSLTSIKGIPPYFRGKLGDGEISLYYFELEGIPLDGSNLFIVYDSVTNRYNLRLEMVVKCYCKDDSALPSSASVDTNSTIRFENIERVTLRVSKENVRSDDLQSALENLRVHLLEITKKDKEKVTVELTLVTE